MQVGEPGEVFRAEDGAAQDRHTGGGQQAYDSKGREKMIAFRLERNGIIMPVDKDEK